MNGTDHVHVRRKVTQHTFPCIQRISNEQKLAIRKPGCHQLHRWYDPNSGRWISEDPIGFAAGDANLYRYVGNAVTGATDPSGLWRVNRAGKTRATATSDHGDTIANLAKNIGLSPSEFTKWLTFKSHFIFAYDKIGPTIISTAELKSDTVLCQGQRFEIPNTIYAAYMGDFFGLGAAFVGWGMEVDYMKRLGFSVTEVRAYRRHGWGDTFDVNAGSFEAALERKSTAKELHGIYTYSHANGDGLGGTHSATNWLGGSNCFYIERSKIKLQYGLGVVVINGCKSAPFSEWASSNGIFLGAGAALIPNLNDHRFPLMPGDQMTSPDAILEPVRDFTFEN